MPFAVQHQAPTVQDAEEYTRRGRGEIGQESVGELLRLLCETPTLRKSSKESLKLEKFVQDASGWLDKNRLAEKDEFEAKQKELRVVDPPNLVPTVPVVPEKLLPGLHFQLLKICKWSQNT